MDILGNPRFTISHSNGIFRIDYNLKYQWVSNTFALSFAIGIPLFFYAQEQGVSIFSFLFSAIFIFAISSDYRNRKRFYVDTNKREVCVFDTNTNIPFDAIEYIEIRDYNSGSYIYHELNLVVNLLRDRKIRLHQDHSNYTKDSDCEEIISFIKDTLQKEVEYTDDREKADWNFGKWGEKISDWYQDKKR